MRITVLIENTCNIDSLQAQHGLSLFIEHSGGKILFDMGQNDLFLENAKSLGVDVSSANVAIVSHGHYDHGGGLKTFLESNSKAPIYVSPTAFGDYYNKAYKYIGLDQELAQNPRLKVVNEPTKLWDGATIYPAPCASSEGSTGLYEKVGEEFIQDTFCHEQYLLLEENGKKFLISGCSHRGITKILDEFKPDVFVGGMHLSHWKLGDELKSLANRLLDSGIEIYTGHCTGVEQHCYMCENGRNQKHFHCGEMFAVQT